MIKDVLLYRCKQTTHTNTTTEENKMILTGKDLVVYRLNKAIKFTFMTIGTLSITLFMMLMGIAFC